MKTKKFFRLVIFLGVLPLIVTANTVVHAPKSVKSLETGWDWAIKNAGQDKGFYIGYTIQRLMGENSHIGSWNCDSKDKVTLYEIITAKKVKRDIKEKSVSELAREILERKKRKQGPGKKVLKEVALLFRFSGKHQDRFDCETVKISNFKLHVELKKGAVYWLGRADKKESVNLLEKLFSKSGTNKVKKKAVTAVSLHGTEPYVFAFLKKVIYGKHSDSIREEAVFWIGEHETRQSVNILLDRARKDHSPDVREKAVFSLYRIDIGEANDGLIELARKEKDRRVRKKAIFWLGQKASNLSAEVLGGIIKDDPNTEVQKQAVFALSQISKGGGIPQLIKIAKTHRNVKVRKQAIFWLGESGDPRALDTIVAILKKRKN